MEQEESERETNGNQKNQSEKSLGLFQPVW